MERIARDSPDKDQRQVVEVLTAYLRENARWENVGELAEKAEYRMPTDIQAILTVLGRRKTDDLALDLSRTFLRKANLQRAQFKGTNLYLADLSEANLAEANLENTILDGANMYATNLRKTILAGAYLRVANPFDIDEDGTRFVPTKLIGAQLVEANLIGAHIEYADFRWSNLEKANLSGTDLTFAEGLTRVQLASAITNQETKLPADLIDGTA